MFPGYTRYMRNRWSRLSALALVGGLLGMARAQQPNTGVTPIVCFPPDNPWNWDISAHNVHPNSAAFIASIGNGVSLRADFSFEVNVVPGTQTLVPVTFGTYHDESDAGPAFGSNNPGGTTTGMYPIPTGARVEGGTDAHCIVVDKDNKMLYETGNTSSGAPWSASGGSVFDLKTNQLRPDGWTSTDAAGLPIFPGLLRYEEIAALAPNAPIPHALRVTVPNSQNTHYYPARHDAGSANANYPPMGLRIRMKASKDISGFSGTPRKVMEALKKYGLFVADNTGPSGAWYISTTVDDRWGPESPYINNASQGILAIHGSDMEAVETVDGAGNPILPGNIPPPTPPAGGGGGGGCGSTGFEAFLVLAAMALAARLTRSAAP